MNTLMRFWSDLKTTDFAALDTASTVAVLPVAATEQHGPHLPLSVDTSLVDAMLAAARSHFSTHFNANASASSSTAQVLVLPTQAVGLSPEHSAFAGTLSLSPATVLAVWTEIGACVARAGVKKLLLFNTHGGHVAPMDIVARELRAHHGLTVFSCSWYNLPLGDAVMNLFPPQEHRFGVHAGDMETSLMLALHPKQVDMGQARDFASASQMRAANYPVLGDGKSAKLGWMMQDYNPQGAAGNAAAASAGKGQALLDAVGQQLARLLQEMVQLPPQNTAPTNP